jgi:hypothetical protein
MSFPMTNRLLAASLALALCSGSAFAGVRGNVYGVQVITNSGPSANTFTFSAGGSFTSIGDLGFYETNGSFSELDLFVFGFWTSGVDNNNVVGGVGPDMALTGIHLFGVFVFGGGSVQGSQVTFFGGLDNSALLPRGQRGTQPGSGLPTGVEPDRSEATRRPRACGDLLDDRRDPCARRR